MKLRRSPTLELAARVERVRAQGGSAWSLSTPSFGPGLPAVTIRPEWSLLTPAAGLKDLREAARLRLFAKWHAPDHECFITAGAKAAIFATLRALVPPGSAILTIAPFWPSYEDLASAAALTNRSYQTHVAAQFRLDLAELDDLAVATGARAILLANPNNPTGRVYGAAEIEGLAAIARRRGLFLVLDESFSDLIYDEPTWLASRCAVDEHVVLVNSFSKNLHLQGLRIGACLAHRKVIDGILTVHQTILSSAPSLSQHLVQAVLSEAPARRPDYAAQRSMAIEFVRRRGWRAIEPDGTFYIFPEVPNLEEFGRHAAARNLFLLSGEAFGVSYGKHFRFCFGRPVEDLAQIIAMLEDAPDHARDG
jgi:aspartate/methionine/tyrosine aminotransferase